MLGYKKLEELYKNTDFRSIFHYYLGINDLIDLLNIVAKNGNSLQISDVIDEICKVKDIDNLKLEIIEKYNSSLSNSSKRNLFESISSDSIKCEKLDHMIGLLNKKEPYTINYELLIYFTISSLKSDKLRGKLYRKYASTFKGTDIFSLYINSIKNPKLREKEFLSLKNNRRKYNLYGIAASFSSDEKKYSFFTTHYTNYLQNDITTFVKYAFFNSKSNEFQLKTIDTYAHILNEYELMQCIDSIRNNFDFVKYVGKYRDRVSSEFDCYDFRSRLESIKNVECIFKLIDLIAKNNSENVVSLINNLENQDLRLRLFEQYKDIIDFSDIWSLIVHLDSDRKNLFIEKYKSYFSSYLFERILHFGLLPKEEFFRNYIDEMNPDSFSEILHTKVFYSRDDFSLDDTLKYLLSFTTNKNTIMNIYNGLALDQPDRFTYTNYIDTDVFTNKEREIIKRLYRENKNLYSTFIFGLVKIPYLRNNYSFLKRLSLYPSISVTFIDVYRRFPKRFNLLIKLLNRIFDSDINTDELIKFVVNYFGNGFNYYLDKIDSKNITDNQIDLLIYKIYKLGDKPLTNNGLEFNDKLSNIDIKIKSIDAFYNYENIIQSRLIDAFNKFNTLEQFKNIVLSSIFGLNIKEAEQYVEEFGTSFNKIKDEKSLIFLHDIKSILSSSSIDELSSFLYNVKPLTYRERYLIEYKAKQYFNKAISDSLYKVNEKDLDSFEYYHFSSIPIYKPKDYCLLIHSLMAYNENADFLGDYNLFWNYNSNTTNHGICCSLISNQNVGQTAPINNVVFGFDSFHENAINNASNRDISSSSDDFCSTGYTSKYMLPVDYINTTRYNHNELVLERKELRDKSSTFESIQPSYVVIYDYFDYDHKILSYRAAMDLNIPIVYIDTKDNAIREKEILNNYKDNVESKYDLDDLIKYLVRYENNFCGYYFIDQKLIKEYFSKKEISNNLDDILSSIYNDCLEGVIDVDTVINFYTNFISEAQRLSDFQSGYIDRNFIQYGKYISKAKKYLKSLTTFNSSSYQRKRN